MGWAMQVRVIGNATSLRHLLGTGNPARPLWPLFCMGGRGSGLGPTNQLEESVHGAM